MADTSTTTFMNLVLPTPTQRLGPQWATDINTALTTIDDHNHTSGKGSQIPTAGINLDANLSFNSFRAIAVSGLEFTQQTALPSGTSFATSINVFNNDLYYTTPSGTAVQLTDGGSIASTPGASNIFELQSVNANLTIGPTDTFSYVSMDTTAIRTITLPLANAVSAGRFFFIKDASGQSNTNNITLTASGSDTVDGLASMTLNSDYGTWLVVSDGVSAWQVS